MPGPLKWQGGLYYFDEKYEIDAYGYDSLGGGAQMTLAQPAANSLGGVWRHGGDSFAGERTKRPLGS